MYCKNCGAQINDDAVFCEKCGAKQTSIQTAKPIQNEISKAANNSKQPDEIIQDFDGNVYAAARFLSERDRIPMNEATKIIRKAKKQLPKTAVQSDRSNPNVPYSNLDEAFRNRIKKVLIIGGSLILVLCIVSAVANRLAKSNRSSYTITTTQNTTRSTTNSVSSDELVKAVKKMIEEDYYEGVADRVEFDGKNLLVVYDYSKRYDNSDPLISNEKSKKYVIETDCEDLANYILDMGNKYTNTWQTITIDCGSLGKAVFDKSMIVNHGYGNYFDYVDGDLLK